MVYQAKSTAISRESLTRFTGCIVLQLIAFWNTWQWYIDRVWHSPEEAVGLIASLSFLLGICVFSIRNNQKVHHFSVLPIIGFLALYGLLQVLVAPAIIKSGVAVCSIFFSLHMLVYGKFPTIGFWGVCLLCLPIVPSLQFYLGYPARIISASLTLPLLQINGLDISRQGTNLVWQNKMLQFDAPCSGVTMLWAGLFLTMFICFIYRFRLGQTTVAVMLCMFFVLLGNVLRASSLFYLETGHVSMDKPWLHEGVGVISFLFTAIAIYYCLFRYQKWLSQKII